MEQLISDNDAKNDNRIGGFHRVASARECVRYWGEREVCSYIHPPSGTKRTLLYIYIYGFCAS